MTTEFKKFTAVFARRGSARYMELFVTMDGKDLYIGTKQVLLGRDLVFIPDLSGRVRDSGVVVDNQRKKISGFIRNKKLAKIVVDFKAVLSGVKTFEDTEIELKF